MRLVCPNCTAQYEVDASLLPDEGTEVQCSACSTVWFQPGQAKDGTMPPPAQKPEAAPRPSRPQPDGQQAERSPRPARPRPDAQTSDGPSQPPQAASQPDTAAPEPANPAPAARSLDPSVAEVLRKEAEFEAAKRAQEASSLEMQEELGLFGPVEGSAHPRGGASRLPDIDDISSTLEPIDSGRGGQSGLPQTQSARKRSFLGGLILPIGLACIMSALYLAAPMLAQSLPALDAPLGSYVALVDKARLAVASLIGVAP
ncbi:MAG: zinc-ribbon domain [Roseibaca calidilacus]|uniref:MJ0042 family finger-like domain-containing protein n=2 Tax=Roseibaca calidilacus TaxID=1666912 RepID=A0A0P7YJ95_9RHOB|nr:MAG: zinc-ribbon domain [Roseibaca calidilacus]CUX83529.1 MJ0042 family finger-like domain-containing protein [Roseibaca calidilacus]